MAKDGITTVDLEEDDSSVYELVSLALSRCSTYSYNPADFPRACEIEEFMSPSFQWPDSPAPSFASRSPFSGVMNAKTKRPEQPIGSALAFPTPKTKFAWWRRKKLPSVPYPLESPAPAHLVRFTQKELRVATGGFRDRIRFSDVYKGRLSDHSLVAVKRFDRHAGDDEFKAVIMSSFYFHHQNILRLIGYCVTASERFLVYPYMANGNVGDWLPRNYSRVYKHAPHDWATRIRVAIGIAKALSHLHDHCNPNIIHMDVKLRNIFLDGSFEPFLGGFNFAHPVDPEKTVVTGSILGIEGYMAPQYAFHGKLSEDVFAYGIALLELITGEKLSVLAPIRGRVNPLNLVRDNNLKGEILPWLVYCKIQDSNWDAQELFKIALLCAQDSPYDRPKMSEVVMMLEVGIPPERRHKLKITKEQILRSLNDKKIKRLGTLLNIIDGL